MTAPQRPGWPALDATLARVDAVLTEPEPGSAWVADRYWAGALWRVGSLDSAIVAAFALAEKTGGDVVAETPAGVVTIPARKYVSPPADTRPGFLGRLRRRLIGEPPQ